MEILNTVGIDEYEVEQSRDWGNFLVATIQTLGPEIFVFGNNAPPNHRPTCILLVLVASTGKCALTLTHNKQLLFVIR